MIYLIILEHSKALKYETVKNEKKRPGKRVEAIVKQIETNRDS